MPWSSAYVAYQGALVNRAAQMPYSSPCSNAHMAMPSLFGLPIEEVEEVLSFPLRPATEWVFEPPKPGDHIALVSSSTTEHAIYVGDMTTGPESQALPVICTCDNSGYRYYLLDAWLHGQYNNAYVVCYDTCLSAETTLKQVCLEFTSLDFVYFCKTARTL